MRSREAHLQAARPGPLEAETAVDLRGFEADLAAEALEGGDRDVMERALLAVLAGEGEDLAGARDLDLIALARESNAGEVVAVEVPGDEVDPAGFPAVCAALAGGKGEADVVAGRDGDLVLFVHLGDLVPGGDDLGLGAGFAQVAVLAEVSAEGQELRAAD